MTLIKTFLAAVAVAGGLTAGVMGAGIANAEPPGYPVGDPPPPGAPAKPPQPRWSPDTPVVWQQLGYRWGVWINGSFLPLY
ncbi:MULTISPECIES: hypothetical protein [unclassified Mycobacterium]|uniref:hypothetical protein n=1 Tax=unclassified Mycobacterium TaxID=2642494 RepID=UPI0029C7AF21|nr:MULTISPECIES: hypothetical protein [unclassified Mycobacterium]